MSRRVLLFGSVLLAIVFSSGLAFSQLSCRTIDTSIDSCGDQPDEVEVLRINNHTNAHAELPYPQGPGQLKWAVCCGVSSLSNQCDPFTQVEGVDFDYLLFLSDTTNAHAEFVDDVTGGDPVTYTEYVCISTGIGPATQCKITALGGDCSDLGSNFECVATISSSSFPSNAHVAACPGHVAEPGFVPYGYQVCCKGGEDLNPPTLSFEDPTPEDGEISADPKGSTNPDDYVDWIYVNITSDEELKAGTCIVHINTIPFPMSMSADGLNCFFDTSSTPDGFYDIYVTADDLNSNTGTTETRTITVFVDPPESLIEQPEEGDAFVFSAWGGQISGTATDIQNGIGDVLLKIWRSDGFYWDGNSWETVPSWLSTGASGFPEETVVWSYGFIQSPLEGDDGLFTVWSNATDKLGFFEHVPHQVTFGIDGVSPTTTLTDGLQNGGTTGSDVAYTGLSNDAEVNSYASLVNFVEYKIWYKGSLGWIVEKDWNSEGVEYIKNLPPAKDLDFSFVASFSKSGEYRVDVRGVDVAGNNNYVASDTLIFDKMHPSTYIDAPHPSGSPYNYSSWEDSNPIYGRANDDSGIESVEILINRTIKPYYWNSVLEVWQDEEYWILADGNYPETSVTWRWPSSPGTYNPGATGKYHIIANATDLGGNSSAAEIVIYYDPADPFVWIGNLPEWTSNETIFVEWEGSDEIGIGSIEIEYDDEGGGLWKHWLEVSGNGSAPFSPPGGAMNNQIYLFRAIAKDLAGNKNTSRIINTTVDLEAPVCTIDPMPKYGKNPFSLSWTVDEDGSGVGDLGVWTDGSGDWVHVNYSGFSCDIIGPQSSSTMCSALPPGPNQFKCGASDLAGNIGLDSPPMTVIIDEAPPTGTITEPDTEWTNTVPFNLEWDFEDTSGTSNSGISHYNVQWKNVSDGVWTNITIGEGTDNYNIPPTTTYIYFGLNNSGDPPTNEILEGEMFWFQARAWDKAGWASGWTEANTRIDTVPPIVTSLKVTDKDGYPVNETNFADVSKITIDSTASDSLSGIGSHTIWLQWTKEGIYMESFQCGEQEQCSTGEIEVGEADEIIYWVEAVDKAGNKHITEAHTLSGHPLANFVYHDILLTTGTTYVLDVQLRNLNPVTLSKVDVVLSSYGPAGFIGGSGDFTDISITGDGSSATVSNLQSGGRGTLQVKLVSSDPEKTKKLRLDAFGYVGGGTNALVSDSDTAQITVVYPASFSALNEWAVLLLISIAMLGYFFFSGRKLD